MKSDLFETPGAYRVGDFEVCAVSEGQMTVPLTPNFMPEVPIDAAKDALTQASLPGDKITTTFNPLLLRRSGALTLIDTGFGPDAALKPGSSVGFLVSNLAAHGISPGDVGLVVISHCHPDHVGGLIGATGPIFPNAEIAVPRVEWDFWTSDAEKSRAPAGRMTELFAMNQRVLSGLGDRVRLYDWETDVTPGLRAVGTPGHSIGHTSFLLQSGSEQVFVQSDLTSLEALFVRHPDWSAFFDQDPALAVSTRRRIYDMLSTERLRMQGFHHPLPGPNYVEKHRDGYVLVPA